MTMTAPTDSNGQSGNSSGVGGNPTDISQAPAQGNSSRNPSQNDPQNSSVQAVGESPSSEENIQKKSEDDPRFSSKFAALSRKDKELRAKEKALREHEAAVKEWRETQQLIKENPLAFMQKSGLTLEQLISLSLQQPPEPDPLRQELAQVKQKLEGWDKQYEEALKAQHDAAEAEAEAQSKASIKSFIEGAKDKFELIAVNDAIDDVYDLIYEDWISQDVPPDQRTPMSLEKAAQAVEDYYFEEAQKFLKANKIRAALSQKETSEGRQPGSQQETAPDAAVNRDHQTASGNRVEERPVARFESQEIRPGLPTTLTNSRTAASAAGAPRAPLSDEESLRRAVSLLKFS